MAGFKSISYNKASQTATIGTGWRLGPLYLALWNLGKVTLPAGNCVTVGVAGHALGGGYGFSSRKFGLVTDNILEAQVVTANGTVVTANANQNSDLYFALRGAGANSFGKPCDIHQSCCCECCLLTQFMHYEIFSTTTGRPE